MLQNKVFRNDSLRNPALSLRAEQSNLRGFQFHPKWLVYAALSLLAAYALAALYVPLLDSYFFADDTQAIWFAASKSVRQIFFDPDNYRGLSGSNFTPMVGITFKIDWLMFRLDPWGYTVHNLISVFLAGIGLFLFLRLYTDTLTSFAAFVLYLLNPLVFSVYSWCSSRHYIEGLFFAFLALYLHVSADRKGKISLLSGIFYLSSSLYKEVYVIIPALAFLLTGGTVMQKMKRTLPMWVCLIVYIIWRLSMLGGIGGYPLGDVLTVQTAAAGVLRLAEFFPCHLFGSLSPLFWGIALFVLLTMSKKRVLYAVLVAPVLLIPIIQVTGLIDAYYSWARYMLHITIFMICMVSLWLDEISKKSAWMKVSAYLIMAVAIIAFVLKDYQVKNAVINERAISSSTAKEFMYSDAPYIHAREVPWFYDGLLVLNKYFFHREIRTMIIPEPCYQKYLSDERVQDILIKGYQLENPPAGSLKKGFITGQIHIREYLVTWDLGPRQDGKYLILRGRCQGLYNFIHRVPMNGLHHFGKYYPDNRPEVFYLRVVYQSTEGWEAITDEYRIELPGNSLITLNHK